MPTKLVPGTSLFVTIFVSVIVTFLHSFNYGSIDLLLVLMLIIGSIIGVQLGQKLGERIDSSGLRALLALLLLIVGIFTLSSSQVYIPCLFFLELHSKLI